MSVFNPSLKNVFVIGPIFREGSGPGGVDYKDQIYNIAKALTSIGADLKQDHGIDLQVTAPDLRVQDIQDISGFALGQIDRCDFAIADISARSPSVMYEIAVLHSLGTPTLLIDQAPVKIEDAVYYLKGLTVREVDSFTEANICDVLKVPVRNLCGIMPEGVVDYTNNPITKHYDGMPLADIRAITGIATSFFSNYLRFVLHTQGPLRSDYTLDRVIIIEPERLQDNFGASVKGRLKDVFGERLVEKMDMNAVFARKFFYYRVGNALVEYPTPLDSLIYSPQYKKTADRLTKHDPTGTGKEEFLLFQKEMISAFRRCVVDLCRINFDTIDPPDFMPIEDFFANAENIGT